MICLLALPILALLGIFSATHRNLATEAFDCVFRRVTLRKCQSGLDTKLKSSITSTVMRKSPRAAGFIFKHFELLSWIFMIIMVASTIYSVQGVYNYIAYGNCNGENSSDACIIKYLDPTSPDKQVTCAGDNCPANCTAEEGD